MGLQGKAGLRRPVPSLGSAGWLVGEEAHRLESIARDRVRRRLEGAGVIGAGHAVATVAAAVEVALKLHGGDAAVLCETGADLHQHRVAAAVRVENFLTGQRDLYRTPGDDCQLGGDQLVREDVAFATEASAIGRGDHADPAHRHLQHLAQCPMHVVRGL